MTIQAETFYRAKCDAEGCPETYPNDNEDDSGASHYPLDSLVAYLEEPGGEFDEPWTIDSERHFCRRHAPGNVDCTECEAEGHRREGTIDGHGNWVTCAWCGGRGYLTPAMQAENEAVPRG